MTGRLDCPLVQSDDRLAVFDCPVVSGNSGGPVLTLDDTGGWQVVGVVSSRLPLPDGASRAIAVRNLSWVQDRLRMHDRRE